MALEPWEITQHRTYKEEKQHITYIHHHVTFFVEQSKGSIGGRPADIDFLIVVTQYESWLSTPILLVS